MHVLTFSTNQTDELVDITRDVQAAIQSKALEDGVLFVFCPHTTAGLTLNENWDPDVRRDVLITMNDVAPEDARHRHAEGNSPAHVKTSLFGSSAIVFVEHGKLQLGQWQGIYLAEFDGPRRRQVWLKSVGS